MKVILASFLLISCAIPVKTHIKQPKSMTKAERIDKCIHRYLSREVNIKDAGEICVKIFGD